MTDTTTSSRLADERFSIPVEKNPWILSSDIDVATPDTKESEGAAFLIHVADAVQELLEEKWADDLWNADGWTDVSDLQDRIYEIADGAPDVYTHTLWKEFVDLAAYQEDDDSGSMASALETGPNGGGIEQVARIALYQIAERLAHSLIEKAEEDRDEAVEDYLDENESFLRGYLECALWSSPVYVEQDVEPTENFDENHDVDDFTDGARDEISGQCEEFVKANIWDLVKANTEGGYERAQAGHDFWLTRNGHGAGFWDRGLGKVGDRLSEAAKVYGESNLWLTSDDKVGVE
jgi:hypothetical protein